MQKYIALLRGINVSGQKKIKMAELKVQLEELPFTDVQTYIQSGNLILNSDLSAEEVKALIEKKIREKYGWEVNTTVITAIELKEFLEKNPYAENEEKSLYFTLLEEKPEADKLAALQKLDLAPEEFAIVGKVIYLYLPKGYGRTKLNNNFFENKLKVSATTRNLKTMQTLLQMAE